MAMRVGLVKVISGSAVAISPDGLERILHKGDIIFAFDIIKNESDEKLVIEFDGGKAVALDGTGQLIINASVINDVTAQTDIQEQDSTVAAEIQKAILAGADPTLIAEAPAAGLIENNGHGAAEITQRLNQKVTPDSGHETIGIGQSGVTVGGTQDAINYASLGRVSLSLLDSSSSEGELVNYQISISQPSNVDTVVTINFYSSATDTASSGTDYNGGSYKVTIPAGQTSVNFSVATLQDGVLENPETFSAQITNVTNPEGLFVIDTTPVVATIIDSVVNIVISPLTDSQANEGAPLGFVVSLERPSLTDTVITLTPSSRTGDSATAGDDYAATPVTVIIPAGQTSAIVSIDTFKDNLFEGPETFSVAVTGASNSNGPLSVNSTPVTATILDTPTVIVVSVNSAQVMEGTPLNFAVNLSQPATTDTVVTLNVASLAGDTATAGSDYIGGLVTVTIPAGQTTANFGVETIKDALVEGAETLSVVVTGASNANGPVAIDATPVQGTILDTPTTPTVSLSAVDFSQAQEGGTISFSVNLSAPVASATTVIVNVSSLMGDSATANVDYTAGGYNVTIAAGATSATFSVPTTQDNIFEGSETFSAKISNATNSITTVAVDNTPVQATILDSADTPTVTLNAVNSAQTAEGGSLTFEVSLSNPSSTATTVTVNLYSGPGDTASAGTDYTGGLYTVTIPAGQTTALISVPTIDDTLFEPTETLHAVITNAASVNGVININPTPVAASITDAQDAPTVSISQVNGSSAYEGAPVSFAVNLSNPSSVATVVTVNVASLLGDSATAGLDYSGGNYTVTIPAGQNSAVFTVNSVDDGIFEGTETFSAQVMSASNSNGVVAINSAPEIGTLLDSSTAPVVSLSSTPAEEGQPVVLTAKLSGPAATDTTITINVYSGPGNTATEGADYTVGIYTITIPAGQTSGTVNVPTLNDTTFEGPETFSAAVTSASSPNGPVSFNATPITNTITDAGDTPVVSLTGPNLAQVSEGAPANFTLHLTNPSSVDTVVTVNLYSSPTDSATASADYAAGSYTVTIPAGQITADFVVNTVSDNLFEGSETFSAAITAANSANGVVSVDDQSVTTTILDVVTVSLRADTAQTSEGTPASFTVSLSQPATAATTVTINVASGPADTAIAGADYSAGSYTVELPAGQTSASFTVATAQDDIVESPETFSAVISSATNPNGPVAINATPATATIIDTTDTPKVSLNVVAPGEATEGSPVSFQVTLTNAVTSDTRVTVNVASLSGDSATAGTDYTGGSVTVTILAGQTSATFNVPTLTDNIFEGHESFSAAITSASNSTGPITVDTTAVQGVILDGTNAPVLSIVTTPAQEGQPVNIEVKLSGPASSDTTVTLTLGAPGDSATPGADYTATTITVVIPAGQTSINVPVATANDDLFEGTETFSVNIDSVSNSAGTISYSSLPTPANITDVADTPTVVLSANNNGQVDEGSPASFTVTLSNLSKFDTVVTLNTSNGSATAGSDYSGGPITVTIPAGQKSASFNVATLNDDTFEGDETFSVAIGNASSGGIPVNFVPDAVIETINDNADKPTVSIEAGSAAEGSPVVFTVSLSNPATVATSVIVNIASLAGNTATAGSDYTGGNVTVTIPAGQTSATFNVATINDDIFEGNETFSGTITSASAGTVALTVPTQGASATATITDAADTPTVTLSKLHNSQGREGSDVSFVVNVDKASSRDTVVVVTVFTASGNAATAGVDYVASTYTVTILAGSKAAAVVVPTLIDTLVEGDETFSARITSATNANGVVNFSAASVIGTIIDNHAPVANNDLLSTAEDTKLVVLPAALLGNDVDGDGDALTITSVGVATHGNVVLNADGTISFTPVANYSGAASFTYTINDGHGGSSTATANINVTPVADAPALNLDLIAKGPVSSVQTIMKETFTDGYDNAGWSPTKLALNSFVDNPNTPANERAPFNSVAWQGQTTNSEWNSFWKVNSATDRLTYNENGSSGSDDAYGMMAFNLASKGYGTTTQYTVSADLFGYDSSQQNNGVGIVFGYTNDSNYFMARWENPGDFYLPGGSLHGQYPGAANQVTLVQMVNGTPVYLGTYGGLVTENAVNMQVQVSQTEIKVYLNDNTSQYPGTTPAISYTYGSVMNGATSAPAIKTIGMYVFDNDNGVAFDNVQVTQPSITGYQYSVNIVAALNDKDGSETLSAVKLTDLPPGVTLKDANGAPIIVTNGSASVLVVSEVVTTITLLSQTPLTGAQINAMTGTVTATESDGSTASTTAKMAELPAVYLVAISAAEGAPVVFELHQSVPSAVDTIVTLVIGQSGDTATAGSDYTGGGTRTVTIPAGTTTVLVEIPTINNTVYEGNETVSAVITSATNATGAVHAITTPVSALIMDGADYQAVTIYNAWASEGNDLLFTVKLSNPSSQAVSLNLEAIGMTASSSDFSATGFKYTTNYTGDYAPGGGMTSGTPGATTWINASGANGTVVTFAAGQTEMQVRIHSVEDSSVEPNETFSLRVKEVVSGTVNNTTDTAIGTILADDVVGVKGNVLTNQDVRVLFGSDASDTLVGSSTNDVLIGGRGNDILTGGPGDDVFVIRHIGEGVDTITDYNKNWAGENDKLNIADVLGGTGVTQANIDNFVRVDGATGMLSINPAGTGTAQGTNVVTLTGVTSGADVRLIIDQLGTEAIVHVN